MDSPQIKLLVCSYRINTLIGTTSSGLIGNL